MWILILWKWACADVWFCLVHLFKVWRTASPGPSKIAVQRYWGFLRHTSLRFRWGRNAVLPVQLDVRNFVIWHLEYWLFSNNIILPGPELLDKDCSCSVVYIVFFWLVNREVGIICRRVVGLYGFFLGYGEYCVSVSWDCSHVLTK